MLNDLDLTVLGAINRDGPTSAYRVRERFRTSLTSTWSSSAGTVYPVIQRLLREGYISASAPTDQRGTQMLQITATGLAALKEWLLEISPGDGAPTADPLRTRLQYVGVAGDAAARAAIAKAVSVSERWLSDILETLPQKAEDNWIDCLATIGSAFQVKARIDWLRVMAEGVTRGSPASRKRILADVRSRLAGDPPSRCVGPQAKESG